MTELLPTLSDVQEAASRIGPYIQRTPLLEVPLLSQFCGFRLLLKAENQQITGSFKVRGAFNNILQLTEDEKRRGLIAMSAGNHAQGVAYAAQQFGIPVTILMPSDAPLLKIENTRAYGAQVEFYDRAAEDREAIGRQISADRGLVLIHPFDNLRTIAGQGTIGLEVHDQCRHRRITPDALIVNCSGGGLAAGISLGQNLYRQPPEFLVAEPETFDDARRSLLTGKRMVNERLSGSICDALLVPHLGECNLPLLLKAAARGLTASDDDVRAAMVIAAQYFKQTLEPGGAVGLACALKERERFQGKTVVVVASGGNIGMEDYAQMLAQALPAIVSRFLGASLG